jgi:hypothetical protein
MISRLRLVRHTGLRVVIGQLTIYVMAAGLLLALPSPIAMADPGPSIPQPGSQELGEPVVDATLEAAQLKAARTGKRVEVPSRFSENMKVWADPDGKTLQAELHPRPIQVRSADAAGISTWAPIDTKIVSRSGMLTAKRVKTSLEFGGAGSTTLVVAKGARGKASMGGEAPGTPNLR